MGISGMGGGIQAQCAHSKLPPTHANQSFSDQTSVFQMGTHVEAGKGEGQDQEAQPRGHGLDTVTGFGSIPVTHTHTVVRKECCQREEGPGSPGTRGEEVLGVPSE